MLKNNHIKNRGSFVYMVTTSQGTTYALNIKSKSKFIAFGDLVLDGLQNGSNNTLADEYAGSGGSHLQDLGGIKNGNSNDLNEKNFLNILDFANSGLETYKSDANFENWEKLEYDSNSNTVTPNPCN